ncbi:hypothetical protein DFH09DRAFT_1078509 [Mycena vulgaris]|nr:hypothetical protein DFH09DRAFT_1078509 [Mycena vulgaris]
MFIAKQATGSQLQRRRDQAVEEKHFPDSAADWDTLDTVYFRAQVKGNPSKNEHEMDVLEAVFLSRTDHSKCVVEEIHDVKTPAFAAWAEEGDLRSLLRVPRQTRLRASAPVAPQPQGQRSEPIRWRMHLRLPANGPRAAEGWKPTPDCWYGYDFNTQVFKMLDNDNQLKFKQLGGQTQPSRHQGFCNSGTGNNVFNVPAVRRETLNRWQTAGLVPADILSRVNMGLDRAVAVPSESMQNGCREAVTTVPGGSANSEAIRAPDYQQVEGQILPSRNRL